MPAAGTMLMRPNAEDDLLDRLLGDIHRRKDEKQRLSKVK
jgi:hypothetical protein